MANKKHIRDLNPGLYDDFPPIFFKVTELPWGRTDISSGRKCVLFPGQILILPMAHTILAVPRQAQGLNAANQGQASLTGIRFRFQQAKLGFVCLALDLDLDWMKRFPCSSHKALCLNPSHKVAFLLICSGAHTQQKDKLSSSLDEGFELVSPR